MKSKTPKVAKLQMKPTQVTTGFATGNYDPATGKAGYTLSQPLSDMRDMFYGAAQDYGANDVQGQVDFGNQVSQYGQGLFNQAAGLDTNQMTNDYYQQTLAGLDFGRQLQDSSLSDKMFSQGRTGYGQGVSGGYVNPQQFARQLAIEQENAALYQGSQDRSRMIQQQDLQNGSVYNNQGQAIGMGAYGNMAGLFGMGTGIESLGMDTLGMTNQFANNQMQWQQAQQQNQQQINNAKASGGGFMGGLGGSLLNMGLNYATSGLSSGFTSAMGGNPFTSIGSSIGGLFSGGTTGGSSWSPLSGSNYTPTGGAGIKLF